MTKEQLTLDNLRRFKRQPTPQEMKVFIKKCRLSYSKFEKTFGIPHNTIKQVISGSRPLPVYYWHIFYDGNLPEKKPFKAQTGTEMGTKTGASMVEVKPITFGNDLITKSNNPPITSGNESINSGNDVQVFEVEGYKVTIEQDPEFLEAEGGGVGIIEEHRFGAWIPPSGIFKLDPSAHDLSKHDYDKSLITKDLGLKPEEKKEDDSDKPPPSFGNLF